MKKDNIRDYATEAFRFYARHTANASVELELSEAAAKDIEAVEKTIAELDRHREPYALDVVKAVYFLHPDKPIRRRDISSRVIQAAFSYQMCESKVYYILAEARRIFAKVRGLRM